MIRKTSRYALFYTEWPSNFWKTSFTWEAFGEEHRFFCTEQAFMWAKAKFFGDEDTAAKILAVKDDPMACKKLGREVKGYDDDAWDSVRYDIMLKVNIEKFWQDPELRDKITSSELDGLKFVEASPYDGVWGVKLAQDDPRIDDERNWKGRNLLGKVLDEARSEVLKLLDIADDM